MTFEYQELKGVTVVTLDSKLSDYGLRPDFENGVAVMKAPEKTVKDCRHIDGCVYFHLGHVPESQMNDLIELFQKLKSEKEGWIEQPAFIIPDHKFII